MNNKALPLIFFALLAIWVSKTYLFKPEKQSFDKTLIQIDTDQINRMIIYPKGQSGERIELTKAENWQVTNGTVTTEALENKVNGIINQVKNIPTKQLISRNIEKQADYEVDENSGKIVELYSGNTLVEKLVVGRFNFNQNTRQAVSYARHYDSEDIYSIDGFISMTFSGDFNSYRFNKITDFNKYDVTALDISIDQKQLNISKTIDNNWVSDGGITIDSAQMDNYLSDISSITSSNFNDSFDNSTKPFSELEIKTTAGDPTVIKVFSTTDVDEGEFIISTSSNTAVFDSDADGIYKRIFTNLNALMSKTE